MNLEMYLPISIEKEFKVKLLAKAKRDIVILLEDVKISFIF